jgi:hypothetical protein
VFVEQAIHCGIVRLPDVPAFQRTKLMQQILERHGPELDRGKILTVRGGRIRIATQGSDT